MAPEVPASLETYDQGPVFVDGFYSQRISDGSAITLYVYDIEGTAYQVEQVTESTVALLQNALADPKQAVQFYITNKRVGLMFHRFRR